MSGIGQIKDSGERQEFDTGAVRDTQSGKPRYDLIPPVAHYRVAMHYGGGAEKYNEWNWAMGIKFSRLFASMYRHLMQFAMGETDEDHMAAVVFGANCIMHFQELIKHNPELAHLDDMKSRIPNTECLKALFEMMPKYEGQDDAK